ncbi:CinA family protein [Pseudonocardia nigra]|uniref:CinA family protein n=1 Tax=Pseudonocardia nigra TaxID=1921578 RepID=UPI001C5F044E|nr:CinA family protein [Pseudonocardia nigra]
MDQDEQTAPRDRLAAQVAELARDRGITIGAAESLTGGMVASPLAAAEASSEWFRGSLVAYASEVKHAVLGVPEGPVVSADAARAMAAGARKLLGADVAVAATGAGGPSSQDGQEPGTVFIAVDDGAEQRVRHLQLDGDDPAAICEAAAEAALEMLVTELRGERGD